VGCRRVTTWDAAAAGVLDSHETEAHCSSAAAYRPPTGALCQVFISHAGEQKALFVNILHEAFRQRHPALEVFVDERCLEAGGDAMPAIFDSLADAFVGEGGRSHRHCVVAAYGRPSLRDPGHASNAWLLGDGWVVVSQAVDGAMV
jgi:hypothetical protein